MNDEVNKLVPVHLLRVEVSDQEADVITLWEQVTVLEMALKLVFVILAPLSFFFGV